METFKSGFVCNNCGLEVQSKRYQYEICHYIEFNSIFQIKDKKYSKLESKICGTWLKFDKRLN